MELPQAFGNNLILASGIVGFVLPVGIAAINRTGWDAAAKAICAFVCSLLAAALLVYTMGAFVMEDWLRSALIVFTMAIVTYNFYWKPSGIAPAVERATG